MEPRLLFPNLPAELRTIVYDNTINPSHTAKQAGLPFTSKTYTFSHTEVTIMPVHFGNANLLALRQFHFQEAEEYHEYLLKSAIQLRINVLFNGHINTFVQEHWDKKIATHLKNLVKKYSWLAKVMDYDIRIFWEPNLNTLDVGKKRRNVGAIVDRMVEMLTGMMDVTLKRKNGVLKAGLQLGHGVVLDIMRNQKQSPGLANFFSLERYAGRRHVREVKVAHKDFRAPKSKVDKPYPQFKDTSRENEDWESHPDGILIFRKESGREVDGTIRRLETVTEPESGIAIAAFSSLTEDCTRIGTANG